MAAYLATQIGEERIKYMRLIKLMYLADRESMARFGEPISFDDMFSMDHGLVLSNTFNAIRVPEAITAEPWPAYFSPRKSNDDYFIGVRRKVVREELDYLSDSDIELLDETLRKYSKMSEWDLSDYMHKHCPEWRFPDGSRIPVDDEELLRVLGIPEDDAKMAANSLKTERHMNRIFKRR